MLVDGHDLAELNLRSVHDQCGLVAQDTQLFGSSIRDNISYGLDSKFADGSLTDADLIEAAKAANAHDFIVKFEDGYDTRVRKARTVPKWPVLQDPHEHVGGHRQTVSGSGSDREYTCGFRWVNEGSGCPGSVRRASPGRPRPMPPQVSLPAAYRMFAAYNLTGPKAADRASSGVPTAAETLVSR